MAPISASTPAGRQHLDRLRDAAHPAAAVGALVGEPHHGDHERHVGLDRRHHLGDRGLVLAHDAQDALARLGQRRKCLQRLERGRQPPSVALVVLRGRSAARSPAPSPLRAAFLISASCRILLPCCTCCHRQLTYRQERPEVDSSRFAIQLGRQAQRRASAASIRAQRLLAAQQGEALEDPGRDRAPGDRDAQRLEQGARLHAQVAPPRPAAPASTCCSSNGSTVGERLAGARQRLAGAVLAHHLVPGRLVDLDRAEREADQAGNLGQRRDLLLHRGDRLLEARVAGARDALALHVLGGAARRARPGPARGCSARSSSESFCSSNTAGERDTRSSENFSISSSVVKKVVSAS